MFNWPSKNMRISFARHLIVIAATAHVQNWYAVLSVQKTYLNVLVLRELSYSVSFLALNCLYNISSLSPDEVSRRFSGCRPHSRRSINPHTQDKKNKPKYTLKSRDLPSCNNAW